MTINISPYLVFNGQAREAFGYYQTVFGGNVELNEFGPMGAEGGFAAEAIMHAQLTTEAGWTLMGSDSTKPEDEVVRGGCTNTVWGDDEARMREQFDKLAADGTVNMPMEKQMWGAIYGDVTDRFGISWSFNIEPAGSTS